MLIFWRLLCAHFIADFTLQSNKINEIKRKSTLGMLAHVFLHPVVSFALTVPYWNTVWCRLGPVSLYGWFIILVIAATHFVEDQMRVLSIRRSETTDNTLYFIVDQIIHIAVIFVASGLMGPDGKWIPERWPVLGCLAVGATHFSVVFIYFLEKDLSCGAFPAARDKYIALVERALAFLALVFIPSYGAALTAAMLALIIPRLIFFKSPVSMAKFSWILGSALSVGFGLLGRVAL